MAVPLFIFAATVCRFIEDPAWSDPADQLEKVLQYQMKAYDSELGKLQDSWNACRQTLEGHSSSVWSVAFSPDSKWIASGQKIALLKSGISKLRYASRR